MATATMITISVHDTAIHTLPADLEERLNKGSPTASPDQLAEALAKHTERAAKLRSAHLDAVRDRAARESQRASEAAARKLRLHHQHVDKIQRKLLASEVKANAKKEKAEAERDARKQKREEMAEAVAEARREATKTREARGTVLLAAERAASAKYSKTREALVAKSHWQVKHAIAVAAAQKEKERRNAVASFERLTERLELAAGRRAMGSGDAAGTSSSSSSTTSSAASSPKSKGGKAPTTWQSPSTSSHPGAVRARVLNDDKVASAMKRKLFEASMDKATTKRAAILEGIKSKAGAENARVASVVASNMAKVAGTDAATVTSKAALYERLCKADVARLQNLKSRHGAASRLAHKHGDTVSVIVIHVDKKARMPPPALSLRLNTVDRKSVV